ncbi:choline dehydrogenase protein [Rutstroemia sp. NJR-2017a BVV2]|nr:choline dehydrogenase protein [Rutstroemia sp. NJR-2017a BVV2]
MWWPFSEKYPERHPKDADSKTYDYIVIGGGIAGCALASRLSENADVSVLVLEYVPMFGSTRWQCETMEHCDNRRSGVIRGEVLGGTSRINSMIYTRGCAADYDAWVALGYHDWSYDKLLPYFVKSETSLDYGDSSHHRNSGKFQYVDRYSRKFTVYAPGPWITRTFTYSDWLYPIYRVFADCSKAMGFILIPDSNASDAPADRLATLSLTLNQQRERVSSFEAFFTTIVRVGFDQSYGEPRTDKKFFKSSDPALEKVYTAKVNKEVIVCAGAIGSPQVLMLSGIGPCEELKKYGIKVVYDFPGVGAELTDHLSVPVAWEVPPAESLTSMATSPFKIV